MLDAEIERQEETCVIHFKGELSMKTIPLLEKKIQQAYTSPVKNLVFDMEGVDFLDSRGASALLAIRQGHASDSEFALTGLDGNVKAVLERLFLLSQFKIFRSVSEALKKLK